MRCWGRRIWWEVSPFLEAKAVARHTQGSTHYGLPGHSRSFMQAPNIGRRFVKIWPVQSWHQATIKAVIAAVVSCFFLPPFLILPSFWTLVTMLRPAKRPRPGPPSHHEDFLKHLAIKKAQRKAKKQAPLSAEAHAANRQRLSKVRFVKPKYSQETQINVSGIFRKWTR